MHREKNVLLYCSFSIYFVNTTKVHQEEVVNIDIIQKDNLWEMIERESQSLVKDQ